MQYRFVPSFFSFFVLASSLLYSASNISFEVAAESAILINGKTGTILYEKQADIKRSPASITKIATAIFALLIAEERLDEVTTADHDCIASVCDKLKAKSNYSYPAHYLEPGATHIALKKGEEISLRDLLYGMMVVSGDDASNLIAKHVTGDISKFMEGVNAYMTKIGCKNSHFSNPHGLYHPDHYTTARDMAVLTKEALKHPLFRQIVSTVKYTRPRTNLQEPSTWVQSNRLLRTGDHYYPYAIGVKTGYIQAAQNTLVSAAEKDGRLLIAVQMKTKERGQMFRDAKNIFEKAFNEPLVERLLLNKGPQTFSFTPSTASEPVKTYLEDDVAVQYYPAEEPQFSCRLIWDNVSLPLKKGDKVGELLISSSDGQHSRNVELKSQEDVDLVWWRKLAGPFKEWNTAQLIAAVALLLVISIGLAAKSRRY